MTIGKRHVHLLAIALVACGTEPGGDSETEGDTETGTDTTGTDTTGDGDAGTDEIGDLDEDESADDGDSSDDTSGNECELGEYTPRYDDWLETEDASGYVLHTVSRTPFGSDHRVDAAFVSEWGGLGGAFQLCVEWLVADAEVGVDECKVYYTLGYGINEDEAPLPLPTVNLEVDEVTFDIGAGPLPAEFDPGGEFYAAKYSGIFDPPPDGVPFGEVVTAFATFSDLPDLDLDVPVPQDLMPIAPAFGSTTVTSEALASWTWSNSGGSDPVELEITIGAAPLEEGWMEVVRIQCEAADDGAFAFPSEYFDLARERLGPELNAHASIVRKTRGQVPFAGENLNWRSFNSVRLHVAIVD
jgi:hypothetical protein